MAYKQYELPANFHHKHPLEKKNVIKTTKKKEYGGGGWDYILPWL